MKDVIVQVDAECGNSSRPYMKYPGCEREGRNGSNSDDGRADC